MRLMFVHSHKFKTFKDNVYTEGQLPYELFKDRYFKYFNKVIVCGRRERTLSISNIKGLSLASGPNVEHAFLPNLSKVIGRYKSIKKSKKILSEQLRNTDVLIARLPSKYGTLAIKEAEKQGKSYIIEVVGDVAQSLWSHGSVIAKVLMPYEYLKTRHYVKKSKYSIYVTESYLQERYPPNKQALVINASNVELLKPSSQVLSKRRNRIKNLNKESILRIGIIGSYSTKYKGIDQAIRLVSRLVNDGVNVELYVLGSGDKKNLESEVKNLGIESRVFFQGTLPGGEEVLKWLDSKDVYVQPSLTEGLPRALIEAMSRGLPAIGSRVGGIPELLDSTYTFKVKNESEFYYKFRELINSKTNMLKASKDNYSKATNYYQDAIRKRRNKFIETFIQEEFNK